MFLVFTNFKCKNSTLQSFLTMQYDFSQEKLSQDIHYLISKESHVKNQITELGLLVKEAEVRTT